MQNTELVVLQDVDLGVLKTAFKRSLSINGENLNFKITKNAISNVAAHESDALYKSWSVPIDVACKSVEGTFDELKVSIYSGSEFVNKIFSYYGQLARFEISHINGNVTKIDIVKLDEKGKVSLKISLVTASVTTAYRKFDDELISQIFNPGDEGKIGTIDLSAADFKQLNQLAKLSTNPETQTKYITLKTVEGRLIATDEAFEISLGEREETLEKIEIEKELFSFIEYEDYSASIYSVGEKQMLLCNSKTSESQIAVILLSDADDTIDWNSFETDTNWDQAQ